MTTNVVALKIKLAAATRQDGDQWLAWCPPLDVVTQGSTEKAALIALREAIALWFESCVDRGVLDKALKEAGFKSRSRAQISEQANNTVVVKERRRQASHTRQIEVMIPAYIAAHTTGSSATC
jgi:predicted RNase H-like HicB family nuclease